MDIVIAGATGFVGTHLRAELERAGHTLRLGTRNPARKRASDPDANWVKIDVDDPQSLREAMEGADAFVLLVHRMRDDGDGLESAEARAAQNVLDAAREAGVQRIVYLGGPVPEGECGSKHLKARELTGRILRSDPEIATIELRAGMIVGAGSESWTIVRDLAFRLPAMVLPAWLDTQSQPIGIRDVVTALRQAVEADDALAGAWNLPGPEVLSAWHVLERIAAHRGMRPLAVRVPLLTPSLSSHWIRLVTRADYRIARHLVDGLTEDLVSPDAGWWKNFEEHEREPFDSAVIHALGEEDELEGWGRRWERLASKLSLPVPAPRRLQGTVAPG